jgi:hypothetical protein
MAVLQDFQLLSIWPIVGVHSGHVDWIVDSMVVLKMRKWISGQKRAAGISERR